MSIAATVAKLAESVVMITEPIRQDVEAVLRLCPQAKLEVIKYYNSTSWIVMLYGETPMPRNVVVGDAAPTPDLAWARARRRVERNIR